MAFFKIMHRWFLIGTKTEYPRQQKQQKEWSSGWKYGSLPHDWKSVKMTRFHGSMTRTENWPLIRANKQHNFHLTAGCVKENCSTSQFPW